MVRSRDVRFLEGAERRMLEDLTYWKVDGSDLGSAKWTHVTCDRWLTEVLAVCIAGGAGRWAGERRTTVQQRQQCRG